MDKVCTLEMPLRQPKAGRYEYEIPTCAICGCTENTPCFGGDYSCFWVTIDRETNAAICSECLGF